MKVLIVIVSAIVLANAAPAKDGRSSYILTRPKKSVYGAPPCATANAGLAPVAFYLAPQAQASGPHYREDDNEKESEEHASARSYGYDVHAAASGLSPIVASSAAYGGSSAGALSGLSLSPAGPIIQGSSGASGPAIGIFPRANVGGCAVPLLLSCAPSVVSGHIAHAAHDAGYSAGGYSSGGYSAGGLSTGGLSAGGLSAGGLSASSYKESEPSHASAKEAVHKSWAEAARASPVSDNAQLKNSNPISNAHL